MVGKDLAIFGMKPAYSSMEMGKKYLFYQNIDIHDPSTG